MSAPRRNLADSVLARAELFRRGMLFDGVPKYSEPAALPAAPGGEAAAPPTAGPAPGAAAPPVEGATDSMVAGAAKGQPLLNTMLDPQQQQPTP